MFNSYSPTKPIQLVYDGNLNYVPVSNKTLPAKLHHAKFVMICNDFFFSFFKEV